MGAVFYLTNFHEKVVGLPLAIIETTIAKLAASNFTFPDLRGLTKVDIKHD
jgi:hypothetical protein